MRSEALPSSTDGAPSRDIVMAANHGLRLKERKPRPLACSPSLTLDAWSFVARDREIVESKLISGTEVFVT